MSFCLCACVDSGVSSSEEEAITTIFTPVDTTFTDIRDGQQYTATNFDGKLWFMTKNLNYKVDGELYGPVDTLRSVFHEIREYIGEKSCCYDNLPSNCEKYGQLYDYFTAKTACPKGWRIPKSEEWVRYLVYTDCSPIHADENKAKHLFSVHQFGGQASAKSYCIVDDEIAKHNSNRPLLSFNGENQYASFWETPAAGLIHGTIQIDKKRNCIREFNIAYGNQLHERTTFLHSCRCVMDVK